MVDQFVYCVARRGCDWRGSSCDKWPWDREDVEKEDREGQEKRYGREECGEHRVDGDRARRSDESDGRCD